MILLSGNTFGQINNEISVDRDSLYNVFINFEVEKAKTKALTIDTLHLREVIRKMEQTNLNLMKVAKNNDSLVIPKYREINQNLQVMLDNEVSNSRKKYWKGAKDFGSIGFLLGIIIMFL